MKIIVHIVSDEENEYVRYCAKALKTMAQDPQSLEVVCRTNITHRSTDASVTHSMLLAEILININDGNIHVICDSDTVVVRRGWDTVVREQLSKVDCFGAPYEDIGGHSSGSGLGQTYKKLPTFVFIVFKPGHPWHLLDVMPRKHEHLQIDTQQLSEIHNLPVGYRMFCDGAWQLPMFFHQHNLTSVAMVQLKADSLGCEIIKDLRDQSALNCHEEYHLDGVPFVMHQRSSRKHQFRGQNFSNDFYTAIENHIPALKP